jgi:hypothetical protein
MKLGCQRRDQKKHKQTQDKPQRRSRSAYKDLKFTRGTLDMFEQTFRNILDKAIGADFAPYCYVRFPETPDAKHVCIVEVKKSKEPVFLNFQRKNEFLSGVEMQLFP